MNRETATLEQLRELVADFVHAREWEQFHNPRNLACAVAVEAAELMEIFLWKTESDSGHLVSEPEARHRVEEELADVVILCLSMCNQLGIDLAQAIADKVAKNEAKYPVALAKGRADKYTRYADAIGPNEEETA